MDNDQTKLPEAPASVTAKVISDKGFPLLFTIRDTKVSNLISKLEQFQQAILEKGWKPEGQNHMFFEGSAKRSLNSGSTVKQLSLDLGSKQSCSKCGAPAKKRSGSRKDGSIWEGVFCSTGQDSHKVWLS